MRSRQRDRLRAASVVVVLLTSEGGDRPTVAARRRDRLAQARLDPTKRVRSGPARPGRRPGRTFAGHPWLVPSSHRADDVARGGLSKPVHLAHDFERTGNRESNPSGSQLVSESMPTFGPT